MKKINYEVKIKRGKDEGKEEGKDEMKMRGKHKGKRGEKWGKLRESKTEGRGETGDGKKKERN